MKRTDLTSSKEHDYYRWSGVRLFASRPATIASVIMEEDKGIDGAFTEVIVRVVYDDFPERPVAVYRALHDVNEDASNDYYGLMYDLDQYINSNRIRNPRETNVVFSVVLYNERDSSSSNESYVVYALTNGEAVEYAKAQSDEYSTLDDARLGKIVRGPFKAEREKPIGTVE